MTGQTLDTFLKPEEVAELTGIRTGRAGKTRLELQIAWLRTSGLRFWVNACGRPIVPRTAIDGRPSEAPPASTAWVPDVLKNAR